MVFKNFDMSLYLVIVSSNDKGVLSYLENMPLSVFNIINRMICESDLDMEYRGCYDGDDNKKYVYCFKMIKDTFTDLLGIDLNLSRTCDNVYYEDMSLILYPLVKDKYYYNYELAMYKKNELHRVDEKLDYSINYYMINKSNLGIIISDDYLCCCNNKIDSGYLYYNIDEGVIPDELYVDDLKNNRLIKRK